MKHFLFFSLFLFSICDGICQIKTPSFAKYHRCPDNFSQISYCTGWRQPTIGSCDYFNGCSADVRISVPQNYFGYQDNEIHAYCGLSAVTSRTKPDYKEYIATKIPALIMGNVYTINIKVSLSDSSSLATDGLGVLFTTYPYSTSDDNSIYLTPQIDYSGYGPIRNKLNWVTLSGTFTADSAYTHLIVGCFKDIWSLRIDTVGEASKLYGPYAYYYIGEIGIPDSTYFGDSAYVYAVDSSNTNSPDMLNSIFPSAFTPNGDGLNDLFRIMGNANNTYSEFVLRVFNRWGQCVFISRDPTEGWNGTYIGTLQQSGVFFYTCNFSIKNKRFLKKGDVTLIL